MHIIPHVIISTSRWFYLQAPMCKFNIPGKQIMNTASDRTVMVFLSSKEEYISGKTNQ